MVIKVELMRWPLYPFRYFLSGAFSCRSDDSLCLLKDCRPLSVLSRWLEISATWRLVSCPFGAYGPGVSSTCYLTPVRRVTLSVAVADARSKDAEISEEDGKDWLPPRLLLFVSVLLVPKLESCKHQQNLLLCFCKRREKKCKWTRQFWMELSHAR